MGSAAGSQGQGTGGEQQCIAQNVPWGGPSWRCWVKTRSNSLCKEREVEGSELGRGQPYLVSSGWWLLSLTLAWAKALGGYVQALAAGDGLQLALIAICDTI
jgi:hypothetical protein